MKVVVAAMLAVVVAGCGSTAVPPPPASTASPTATPTATPAASASPVAGPPAAWLVITCDAVASMGTARDKLKAAALAMIAGEIDVAKTETDVAAGGLALATRALQGVPAWTPGEAFVAALTAAAGHYTRAATHLKAGLTKVSQKELDAGVGEIQKANLSITDGFVAMQSVPGFSGCP